MPDKDIRSAHTLPSDFYQDHHLFALQQKSMFRNVWHWVGRIESEVNLKPVDILPDFLDMPVLLTRQADRKVTALPNVCTHRASILCKKQSSAREIICPYHGRRFNLEGQFLHMPGFKQVLNFPNTNDYLTKLKHQEWRGFHFVSVAGNPNFQDSIDPIESRISFLAPERMTLDASGFSSYTLHAHWALYIDNYLEGFHIPFVHPGLNASLNVKAYEQHLFPFGSLQIGIGDADTLCFDLPESSPDYGKRVAAYYFWLFPNLMLNFYPWGLSVNKVEPISPFLTRIVYETYVLHPELKGQGAGGDLGKVEAEDQEIVEGVQKGIISGFYKQGRYSPEHESGVHHFHRLLAQYLSL